MNESMKKMEIWKYFRDADHVNKIGVCKFCYKALSYKSTIGNLKRHIIQKHTDELPDSDEDENMPQEEEHLPTILSGHRRKRFRADEKLAMDEEKTIATMVKLIKQENERNDEAPVIKCEKSTSHDDILVQDEKLTTINEIAPPISNEKPIRSVKVAKNEKFKIDRSLLDLFIKDFQPFSIVEDEGFKKYSMNIPGYRLPSEKEISSFMIPALFLQTYSNIKNTVQHEAESVCITVDIWTSSVNNVDNYAALSAHYITKSYEFKSVLLKCCRFSSSKSSAELGAAIRSTLIEWKLLDKVNLVVSDSTNDFGNCIEQLFPKKYYGCYARDISLIVQSALRQMQEIIEKMKTVVSNLKGSTFAASDYRLSANRSLVNQCPSSESQNSAQEKAAHWNETYHALGKFVKLENTFKSLRIEGFPPVAMRADECLACRQLYEALKPFEELTGLINEQKYMAAGLVIVFTTCIIDIYENLSNSNNYCKDVQTVIVHIRDGLKEKFKNIEHHSMFSICTILDPRYKQQAFKDETAVESVKKKLQNMIENLTKSNETGKSQLNRSIDTKNSFLNRIENLVHTSPIKVGSSKAAAEIDSYLKETLLLRHDELGQLNCPLAWWRRHQAVYPNLSKIFITNCNIVATSIPSERIFSQTGRLLCDRRSKLKSKKLDMLMFLHANIE